MVNCSYCLVYLVGIIEVITLQYIGHTPEELVLLVEVVEVSTVQVVHIFESLRIVLWYQGACQTVLLEKKSHVLKVFLQERQLKWSQTT